MIRDEILNKLLPLPDEEKTLKEIKTELADEGFVITNFNKGGIFYIIIRIFVLIYIELMGFARQIVNSLFIKHAEGDWLEVKSADFGKYRKAAVKAKGFITIYRENFDEALLVKKGHMFKTLPDVNGQELKFYVVADTVISANEATGAVLVEAEKPGTGYNLTSGQITISMIHLDGVSSVVNEQDWLYEEGADIENLEKLRERTIGAWDELAERTTEAKLINVAKKVNGVLDVQVDAQHPRGQGTTDIMVTGTGGVATDELLQKVESATAYLKGNYDDWNYMSSIIVKEDIDLTLYLAKNVNTDGVTEQASRIIEELMQISKRTELNCLYLDDIRYGLKDQIPDCRRVVIKKPASDIELSKGSVVMIKNLIINVDNVGGE